MKIRVDDQGNIIKRSILGHADLFRLIEQKRNRKHEDASDSAAQRTLRGIGGKEASYRFTTSFYKRSSDQQAKEAY